MLLIVALFHGPPFGAGAPRPFSVLTNTSSGVRAATPSMISSTTFACAGSGRCATNARTPLRSAYSRTYP